MNFDDQKVQVADEIKPDIWKYLVSSDVADDAWYNYACYISHLIMIIMLLINIKICKNDNNPSQYQQI